MKDWIKVTDAHGSRLIRVADIEYVYSDEKETVVEGSTFAFSVKESVDEILQLIEGEKAQDRLLEALKKAKKECLEAGDKCHDGCTNKWICNTFYGNPCNWNLTMVEEALR